MAVNMAWAVLVRSAFKEITDEPMCRIDYRPGLATNFR